MLRACRVLCHGEALRGVRSYSSSAAIGSNHRPVGALVEFTVHQVDPQLQANLRRQLRYSRARLPTTIMYHVPFTLILFCCRCALCVREMCEALPALPNGENYSPKPGCDDTPQ